MHELRWNPLVKWWVMVASGREKRPLSPKKSCPFCPGSEKVPRTYDVMAYPNDWPILSPQPPEVTEDTSAMFRKTQSFGKCEVILYSPDHNATLGELPDANIRKLIDLWVDKYNEMRSMDIVKYVFIFENRGEEIGATIDHPHGQMYGFPFIPKKMELELEACREYREQNGNDLYGVMLTEEIAVKKRIVDENESFVTFVPFFAEYPYQVYIVPRKHRLSINELNENEKKDLGNALRRIVRIYDNLFERDFPYMMSFDQQPVDGKDYSFYRFHVKMFPPLRNKITQKFNASSETAAWVHGNPSSPEEKAEEMRKVRDRLYD